MNEQRRAAADAPAGEQAVVTTTVAELQEAGDNSEAATQEPQERNMDSTEQTSADTQANADQQQQREQQQTAQPRPERDRWPLWALLTVAVILLAGGFLRGRSAGGRHV